MKRLILSALLIASLCGIAFAADPAVGFWKSIDEKSGKITAYWTIYEKGDQLWGEILYVPGKPRDEIATSCDDSYKGFPVAGKVNTMHTIGTPWIWGLTKKAPGQWAGGNIIDPGKGDMYKCKITFHATDGKKFAHDVLEMRGEIGLGIGRSQFWERATEAEFK